MEFWHEILGVGSEDFNLLFQTTGVLIINDILDFESPYFVINIREIINQVYIFFRIFRVFRNPNNLFVYVSVLLNSNYLRNLPNDKLVMFLVNLNFRIKSTVSITYGKPKDFTQIEIILVCNHFNQPKLVWICMILTKNADRCWESKIEGSVVKLFLSNWGDTQAWFHWLPAQRAPPGMLPACWKNNRLEKSVVQIYTKNSHQKMVG